MLAPNLDGVDGLLAATVPTYNMYYVNYISRSAVGIAVYSPLASFLDHLPAVSSGRSDFAERSFEYYPGISSQRRSSSLW